jgi:hypothetical protein
MTQILHNIKSISAIECRLLQNLTFVPGEGVMLNYWRNFEELPLVGLASMEISSKVENKSRIFTTKISANLSNSYDVAHRHIALLLKAVDGTSYLVGSAEPPYPIINTTDNFPEKETSASGCNLSVEYNDTLGLMRVLD